MLVSKTVVLGLGLLELWQLRLQHADSIVEVFLQLLAPALFSGEVGLDLEQLLEGLGGALRRLAAYRCRGAEWGGRASKEGAIGPGGLWCRSRHAVLGIGDSPETVDFGLELLRLVLSLREVLLGLLQLAADAPNLFGAIVLHLLEAKLDFLEAVAVGLRLLVLELHQAPRRLELLPETLLGAGGGFLQLLDLGQGLLSLGLGLVESLAELLLCAGEGFDVGEGVLVLALQLGDARALLLPDLEVLGGLGLELGVIPVVVLLGELELLLEGLLAVLGRVRGGLGGLDRVVEGRGVLVELQDLLVLFLQLLGEASVGGGLGIDDGEGLAVRGLEGRDARAQGLDFGERRRAGGLERLELILEGAAGGFWMDNAVLAENDREWRGGREDDGECGRRAFALQLLAQLLDLLQGLVAGGPQLLASRLGAAEGSLEFDAQLEFVLLEVAQLGDDGGEDGCDEIGGGRGHDGIQVGLGHASMGGEVAEVYLGRRHCGCRWGMISVHQRKV